jgi:KDO2-lipid IV(A) lauroyltransferase
VAAVQYWAWRIATAALARVPLRFAYAVAGGIGWAGYWLWPRGRRNAVANYRVAFPGARSGEAGRLARASFVAYLRYLVDFARMPSRAPSATTALVSDPGGMFDEVERRRAAGQGAIAALMHFGVWDLPAAAAGARGIPVTAVVEPFADGRLDARIADERRRMGMTLVPLDKVGPSLVKGLRRRGTLALLIDRPGLEGGIEVPFFGQPVTFPGGPARLALQTGATLLAVAAVRVAPWRPEAILEFEFIDPDPGARPAAEARRLTAAAVAAHERWIRRYPEQWYMFRAMFPSTVHTDAR